MLANEIVLNENCRVIPVREMLQSCSKTVLNKLLHSVDICTCCGELVPKHINSPIRTTGKCKLCNSLFEEMRKNSFEALENMVAISRYLKIEINKQER
ncbi:MAG: hypothetical protein JW776_15925 [Candidatus Lokiarchaeota archaeon]|nr:hypothetical protein [Candidatus Lokiarchaeota archaeon]